MTGLTFLSWVREGLAADGGDADPLAGPLPAHATVTLHPRLNDRPELSIPTRLYGPGDVTGVDPQQVVRCSPAPDSGDAQPNMLAAVEFDQPDLPWTFSAAAADGQGRLRPWLVLVVVPEADAEVLPGGQGGLARLRCATTELPDLDESWMWAHAQVVTQGLDNTDSAGSVGAVLANHPELATSRLLSPRRLLPQTRYVAAVVPAFEAGRLTGLGRELTTEDEARLRPAWTAAGPTAKEKDWELPVYHHWRFGTGLDGDFESLVTRLTPRALPGTAGARRLDVSDPGGGLPKLADHGVVDLAGALRTAGTDPRPWHADTADEVGDALERVLDAGPDPDDPALTPPVHGSTHAGTTGMPSPQAGPKWLRTLNRDPRHRAAAGLGAEVVRAHQEELVAAAWDQAAEVRRANEALRQGQLARTVADSLHRRLDAVTTDDAARARLLQVTAPAEQAAGAIAANQEAHSALDPAFRKVLRPGGPLAKGTGRGADTTAAGLAAALSKRTATATPDLPQPAGVVNVEDVAAGKRVGFDDLGIDRLTARPWENRSGPTDLTPEDVPGIRNVGAAWTDQSTGTVVDRVFVTTHDGRVMSARYSGGAVTWTDHGRPEGTAAVSAPAALGTEQVVVLGEDGQLHRLAWDGDRWAWKAHARLPGTPLLALAPFIGAAKRSGKPGPGDTVTSGTYYSVFAVTTSGTLVELDSKNGGTWSYSDHGTPPGATLVPGGRVSFVADWTVTVVANGGRLWTFSLESGSWSWFDTNRPGVTGLSPVDPPIVLGSSMGGWGAKGGSTTMLYERYLRTSFPIGFAWRQHGLPHPPVGQVLGKWNNRGVYSTTRSTIAWFDGSNWVERGPRGPVAGDQALQGVLSPYGNAWLTDNDGRLLRFDMNSGAWYDHGRPNPGGRGALFATPTPNIRWRNQVGFRSNLLVATRDSSGPLTRFGRDTDFDGTATAGWMRNAVPDVPATAQSLTLCAADLGVAEGTTTDPDLVAVWVQSTTSGTRASYRVGRALNAQGAPQSWGAVRTLPDALCTTYNADWGLSDHWTIEAATATLADLDGDGRQELVFVYVGGTRTMRRLFLRIGWKLDPVTGAALGGWSDSVEIPWPGRPSSTAPAVAGISVAVADLNGDLRPELVVLLTEKTAAGVTASYRIGWNLNARGTVAGIPWGERWSDVRQVPGVHPTGTAGVALAVADYTGSQLADLVVLVAPKTTGPNRAVYRIGRDVVNGTPTAWSDPITADPSGPWGDAVTVCSLAVVDLPGGTLEAKIAHATRFRAAAAVHQTALLAAQSRAELEDEPRLPLAGLADAVTGALDPEVAVTGRVLGRVGGVDLGGAGLTDPLSPLLTPPVFEQPMAELLAELGQDHLLPGVESIPAETLTLLRTNSEFVESFLVGANDALGRELLWRGFPTDRRATSFRQFWDKRGTTEPGHEPADVPPIAQWPRRAGLGEVAGAHGEQVVLLLRGELVRRFPGLTVVAGRALPPRTPGGPCLLSPIERVQPLFLGRLHPDVLYVGFPLSVAEVRGTLESGGSDPGWFFVFEEEGTEPRFGLDAVPTTGTVQYGVPPTTWRDLTWASVAGTATELAGLRHLRGRLPYTPSPVPLRAPRFPQEQVATATWAHNSAHVAHATYQPPARVAFHATDLLPSFGAGWRVTHVRKHGSGSDRVRELAGPLPGGGWWRATAAEVVEGILGRENYYVETTPGVRVNLVAVRTGDRVDLRTEANDTEGDNLSELPPIPAGAGLPPQLADATAAPTAPAGARENA
ncbi:hypothetical protein [Actinokineospora spheciospongiae]|uniref:hypothetical protein n=1 Tax=Actinokineospora spheciospongiae TaxID=909613 RepID=UPI000D709864|nr:hypothetical protein [Actinokineospora spheciospongiae]PWW63097.1 hypothetical protein DFQ13_10487 [Actinokineospora spheciospongiae]